MNSKASDWKPFVAYQSRERLIMFARVLAPRPIYCVDSTMCVIEAFSRYLASVKPVDTSLSGVG